MSAFRVGQRVRIVRLTKLVQYEGMETRIVGRSDIPGVDWIIELRGPNGSQGHIRSEHLEPILPEGAAPSTWAECAWQPEHMRANA